MRNGYRKINRKKRIIQKVPFLFIGFVLLGQIAIAGQVNPTQATASLLDISGDDQEHLVSVNFTNEPLSDVLHRLARKVNVGISYDTETVPSKLITYQGKNKSVYDVLDIALKGTGLYVTLSENRKVIVIKKRPMQQLQKVQEEISGTVSDALSGETLPGVNVMVKGTTTGTSTDSEGGFELTVGSLQDTLIFSFIGYQTQEVPINDRTEIDIALQSQAIAGEELVVVGYGTQEKKSLTSSVSTIGGEEIESVPVTDLSNAIGGRLSGVMVKQTSGQPGRDGSNINIRGVSTIGASDPLLVVDGVPRNFQGLDPNSIESFTVLKDAAAVAPYGVAGANGVILVTTKQGQSGSPTITYNGYMGFQNPTTLPDFVNGYQYATLKNIAAENVGQPKPYSEEAVQKFKDGSDPDRYPPYYDVWGTVMNENAMLNYHNLEISGGSDKTNYYANIGYQNQEGMWHVTNSRKINLSLNLDADVTNTTNIAFRINGNVRNSKYPPTDRGTGTIGASTIRAFELIKYAHPEWGPLVYSNGMYGAPAMGSIHDSGSRKINSTRIYSQLSLDQEVPFISGLQLKGTIAYDPNFTNQKLWSTPVPMANVDFTTDPYTFREGIFGETKPSLHQSNSSSYQLTYQASLNYSNTFGGKHNLDLTGVFEAIKNNGFSLGASRRNYNLYIDEISMGSSNNADMTTSGSSSDASHVGLVYRVSYDYDDKYLFEVSGRYDGHYYFAPDERWGFFPAFSLGWRLSEEKFVRENIEWIDNLKLRASYGEVGALAGGPFQYLSTYGVYGPGYALGGSGVQAVFERSEPNPNITWERAKKTDIGLELGLWGGLVNIEADYFYEKRSNMLIAPDVVTPVEYGIGLSQVNDAIMENRGVELSAGFNYDFSNDLNIGLNGTFTYAKNKVLDIYESEITYNNPNRRRTGRPLGTQFGLQAVGYFEIEDFNSDGNLKSGIANQPWGEIQPGDIRYKDVSGDNQIDAEDRVPIGDSSTPGIIYGFSPNINYKNFSINVLFQGVSDADHYFEQSAVWPFENGRNALVQHFDHCTSDNTDAEFPRLTPAPRPNNTQFSSKWMWDVSYLRIKSAKLGYTLPTSITEKIKINNAQIYLSGQNIHTWSGQVLEMGIDPESVSSGGYNYPQQRVFTIGISLTL